MTNGAHAPVLSTAQDESTFTYAVIKKSEVSRKLHIPPGEEFIDVIRSYYSIDELVRFLERTIPDSNDRLYKRVTLQFPDSLICDSAAIVSELQSRLGLDGKNSSETQADSETDCCKLDCLYSVGSASGGRSSCCGDGNSNLNNQLCAAETTQKQRLWILADTSYSSCCVDEVAAEHVHSDLVIHFGDACLNPVASLPSAYVFGSPQIELSELVAAFKNRYPLADFEKQPIVLMADAPYTHLLKPLSEQLADFHIVIADLVAGDNMHFIGYEPLSGTESTLHTLNRVFIGIDDQDADLTSYDLFHITRPEAPRLLQLTTKFQSVTTFQDGQTSQGPFPNLMRRYRYMHMARAAGTIGILVNTLSLANTKTLIREVGERIKAAGKRHYVFVVGKPNVAKLANFDAVDLWCVLGCDHQGIILDEYNEYFKPIVTPYELLLAIGDEFLWTGKWVTEFNKVLDTMADEEEDGGNENENGKGCKNDGAEQESDEEPEFDPVTGRYVSSARPLRRLQHLQISHEGEELSQEDGALVKKLGGTIALRGTVSTAAAHLQTREWKGLGSDWNSESSEAALVEEGTSGIARGYEFDTKDAAKNGL